MHMPNIKQYEFLYYTMCSVIYYEDIYAYNVNIVNCSIFLQ